VTYDLLNCERALPNPICLLCTETDVRPVWRLGGSADSVLGISQTAKVVLAQMVIMGQTCTDFSAPSCRLIQTALAHILLSRSFPRNFIRART
jgi:hypothetical protein